MVAVRAADLACPAGPGLGKDGRTALTPAGAGKICAGELDLERGQQPAPDTMSTRSRVDPHALGSPPMIAACTSTTSQWQRGSRRDSQAPRPIC